MLQNDFAHTFEDFEWPFPSDHEQIKELLKNLLQKHQSESISGAYFHGHELESIKESLPKEWKLEIDQSTKIKPKTLRIYIYNLYNEASRNIESNGDPVNIKAIYIKDDIWVVDSVDYEGDDEAPLELAGSWGESRIRIGFETHYRDRTVEMEFEPHITFEVVDMGIEVVIDKSDLIDIANEIQTVYGDMLTYFDLP